MDGYCVKCRQKRTMKNVRQEALKNGRPATRGECEVCNTKMVKIGSAK